MSRGRLAAIFVVVVVLAVGVSLFAGRSPFVRRPATPHGLLIGVTHTERDLRSGNPPAALSRAESVMSHSVDLEAQSIMGWGVGNPEPSPGHYNWSSLDGRVALMLRTTHMPVITLCCAPDWMKGGRPGQTVSSRLTAAPLPRYYTAFADLAVTVAKRYPMVRYFQVWNELKGFYDAAHNRWDSTAYTKLYNTVYAALKAYDPTVEVGGPYVRVDLWKSPSAGGHPSALRGPWGIVDQRSLNAIEYWLSHKRGAQFLTVDGSSRPRDATGVADPLAALGFFSAVDRWLAARTSLPIWWSEIYVGLPAGVSLQSDRGAAVMAAALVTAARSGARAALLWDPEREAGAHSPGLWTSTGTASGGSETRLGRLVRQLAPVLHEDRFALVRSRSTWTAAAGQHSVTIGLFEP